MEILKEEVLGKVVGGDMDEFVENLTKGLAKGLCKNNGLLSVVRGAAQIGDGIEKKRLSDFSKGLGTSIGGVVQICAVFKLVQWACNKLSQN